MRTLLLLTIIGMILVTSGLVGMYFSVVYRLRHIEREIRTHKSEITEHKRKIGVLERRDMKKSDNVYLFTVGENDVKFPSKEGL